MLGQTVFKRDGLQKYEVIEQTPVRRPPVCCFHGSEQLRRTCPDWICHVRTMISRCRFNPPSCLLFSPNSEQEFRFRQAMHTESIPSCSGQPTQPHYRGTAIFSSRDDSLVAAETSCEAVLKVGSTHMDKVPQRQRRHSGNGFLSPSRLSYISWHPL